MEVVDNEEIVLKTGLIDKIGVNELRLRGYIEGGSEAFYNFEANLESNCTANILIGPV